ncbi:MAG: hypothetical protein ACPF8V_07355 [Luteibaculum sp.]
MESVNQILLWVHVSFGFASLGLFWMPVIFKKGASVHKKTGKYYVSCMWVVVVSAAVLSFFNLLTREYIMAAFLGFIAVITANPLWYGIAILKQKRNYSTSFKRTHVLLQVSIICLSLALIGYGIILKGQGAAILMFIFGALGLTEIPGLIKNRKTFSEKADWLKQHIVGMCSSGIAAYTAFLVFGARSFLQNYFDGAWSVLPWVLPTIVGSLGIRMAVKRFSPTKAKQKKVAL